MFSLLAPFCIALWAVGVAVPGRTAPTGRPAREEAAYLLGAARANLDRLQSGHGKAVWRISAHQGAFFGVPQGVTRSKSVDFSFQGSKLRFDITYGPGKRKAADGEVELLEPLHPSTKAAYDGSAYYEYVYYPIHQEPGATPDAYIREGSFSEGGELVGSRVDIKWLMKPKAASMGELRKALSTMPMDVRRLSAEEVQVTINEPDSGDTLELVFDERQGLNIVREELASADGEVSWVVHRSYRQHEGCWCLSHFRYERPSAAGTGDATGSIDVEIDLAEINNDIPADTFNLLGFGLPARTHVWDLILGVDYTLSPEKAVTEQVERLLSMHAHIDLPGADRAVLSHARADAETSVEVSSLHDAAPGPLETIPRTEAGRHSHAGVIVIAVCLGLGAAAVGLLLVLALRRVYRSSP